MSMTYEYTVKVYADAVRGGMRKLESIPEEYLKDVKKQLSKDQKRSQRVSQGVSHLRV